MPLCPLQVAAETACLRCHRTFTVQHTTASLLDLSIPRSDHSQPMLGVQRVVPGVTLGDCLNQSCAFEVVAGVHCAG